MQFPPEALVKHIRTVGVIVKHNGKILILHRNPEVPQGNTWGLPAGKVEPGETDKEAALRELFEETGYRAQPEELNFFKEFHWDFSDVSIDFPVFTLNKSFPVKLDPNEHKDFQWVSPEKCSKKDDLIHGFSDILNML